MARAATGERGLPLKAARLVLAILLAMPLALLAWGLAEPYFVDRQAYAVHLPGLPAAWNGQTVAVVSDFQVGMWLDNTPTVRRIVRRLVEDRPALVLILGDFVYHGGADAGGRIRQAADLVRPLAEANIPAYAVLGNHDYSVVSSEAPSVDLERARRLADALEAAGVRVLQNEAVALETPGVPGGEESLYLVGIGAHLPGLDDPAGAVDAVPRAAARLVMMHNPDSFAAIPSGAAPLALAGHTHGGQMRLPFTPEWSWMAYLAEDEVHVDGWIEDYGQAGNRLYVNRGIGFSKLPLRINCPPEVTILKLLPGGAPQGKRADGQMARGATAGGTDWQFVFGRVWEVTIDG